MIPAGLHPNNPRRKNAVRIEVVQSLFFRALSKVGPKNTCKKQRLQSRWALQGCKDKMAHSSHRKFE